MLPFTSSVTVQRAPAGIPSYVRETVPDVPAGISNTGRRSSGVSSQITLIRTGPRCPSAVPGDRLVHDERAGGGKLTVSLRLAVTGLLAGIVTDFPLPSTVTRIVSVWPSAVSVTVQWAPAAMSV